MRRSRAYALSVPRKCARRASRTGRIECPALGSPRRSSPGFRLRGSKRPGPRRLDADLRPSVDHRFLFGAIRAEQIAGGAHATVRGGLEVGSRCEALGQRLVPDFAGLLPREAAYAGGCEEKGVVGNTGIDVHAAIVVGRVQVVAHVLRLRILAKQRIIVSGAWVFHGAQGYAINLRGQEAGADEPVGLISGLPQGPLLHQRAEDVG